MHICRKGQEFDLIFTILIPVACLETLKLFSCFLLSMKLLIYILENLGLIRTLNAKLCIRSNFTWSEWSKFGIKLNKSLNTPVFNSVKLS